MFNSELLMSTAGYLTLQMRCRVNRYRYVLAGPQQWRFINCMIEGFWKLESVC